MPTASPSDESDDVLPTLDHTTPFVIDITSTLSKDRFEIFEQVGNETFPSRRLKMSPIIRCLRLLKATTSLYELSLTREPDRVPRIRREEIETLYLHVLENVLALSHELAIPLAPLLRRQVYPHARPILNENDHVR